MREPFRSPPARDMSRYRVPASVSDFEALARLYPTLTRETIIETILAKGRLRGPVEKELERLARLTKESANPYRKNDEL